MRWAEGGRGVRRAREPDVVVMRIGEGAVVGSSLSLVVVVVVVVEVVAFGGRRVRVEGKRPVWKVVWWRRRVPDMDFGSDMDVSSCGVEMERRVIATYVPDRIAGCGCCNPRPLPPCRAVCHLGGNRRL